MDAERRQVTVLFTDMVGFTSFSERAGEEAAFTLMQAITRLMEDAVGEEGGSVRSFTGDGIMAIFGAPVALEGMQSGSANPRETGYRSRRARN